MLQIAPGVRVYLACRPVDMRNYAERRIMRSPGRRMLCWTGFSGCSTPHNISTVSCR
jgi:hypothetical protein